MKINLKKTILGLSAVLALSSSVAFAETKCFLVTEHGNVIKQEGNCMQSHSPCSTFKIPISLMGFDSGILIDEHNPSWAFKEEYKALLPTMLDKWYQPHDPTLYMKNSAIWFSQVITQKLGEAKFEQYIQKLNYGNQDVSGDKGKNNGLTHAWLMTSLKISPEEQVEFLRKLVTNKLSVSLHAQEMTKNILFIEDFQGGWKLYGKTGSGDLRNKDGSTKPNAHQGWFVGWLEKGERKLIFAHYIQDDQESGGPRAKEMAKEKLKRLIALDQQLPLL